MTVPDTSGLDKLIAIIDSISSSKLAGMKLSEDQVAYLYLVRAFRRLSTISEGVMNARPDCDLGRALLARMEKKRQFFTRRQKDVLESVDAARSVLDIHGAGKRVKGDCMIIVRARNCFAHEAEQSSRVLAAACAIGAVGRLLDFIFEHCKLGGEASPLRDNLSAAASEISEYQAKLLARMGALDLPYLLQQLALSHADELAACQYSPLLSSDYAKAMFLLTTRIPGHLAACPAPAGQTFALSADPKQAKRQRSLLRTVMLVPPSLQDARAAVDWLLSSPAPSLLGCSGLRALCHGLKKGQEGTTFEDSWMECVPTQSQEFLLQLIDATNEHAQSQQDVLDAEGAYDVACEKSQEAREKVRTFDHGSHPDGESELQRLTRLCAALVGHKEIWSCVMKRCEKVAKRDCKEEALKALLTDDASLRQAKRHLSQAFQEAFGSDGGVTWDVAKQMCCLLQSTSAHELFHSVFHPAQFFTFFNVFSRAGCSVSCSPMFEASVEMLDPMLQFAGANPDVAELEACLASNYLHGMTMLAVLGSRSLQQQLAPRSTHPRIPMRVAFTRLASGMSATVVADDKFIGREDEMKRINKRVRPLFATQGGQDKSLVMIRGQPGTGKSCLAKQQLCLVQNEFCVAETSAVFANCMPGRGGDAVRDALHRMGLDLRFRLGIGSAATVDIVLPLLTDFLSKNRFVLLVDDVDQSGLEELFRHVPGSRAGCCIVLTSQMEGIEVTASKIAQQFGFEFNTNANCDDVHLQCFTPAVALELVQQICKGDKTTPHFDSIRAQLPSVLSSGLGLLPLGVRVFAEWLRLELLHGRSGTALGTWNDVCNDVTMPDNVQPGHRGLRATVRLALQNIDRDGESEACRHVLGLLALCRPDLVPWSLFDGGSDGEGQQLFRGSRVEVSGKSLEFVSSAGERCRVMRLKSGKAAPKPRYATVASDRIVDGKIRIEYYEGNAVSVPVADLEFGPHVGSVGFDDGRCVLQLQQPAAAKRAELTITNHFDPRLNGSKVFTNHNFTVSDPKSDDADNRLISVTFADTKEEKLLHLKHLQLPEGAAVIDNQLVFPALAQPAPPSPPPSAAGRVLKYHRADALKRDPANDTVSVVFGCESGACLLRAPRARPHLLCA